MLLRIGTLSKAEYRLWLTRRVVRSLWDALLKMVEAEPAKDTPIEPEKREAILQFEHQSAVEQADFKTPFEEAAESFPLGEDGVLVSSISGGRKEDGAFVLKLGSSKGKAHHLQPRRQADAFIHADVDRIQQSCRVGPATQSAGVGFQYFRRGVFPNRQGHAALK